MKIALVGDVMLGRLVNQALKDRPPDYPWGDTLAVLKRADLRVCNLECAISDDGEPWSASPKEFHFRSDSRNVEVLLAGGIDAVSLANNHVLDFGYDGLRDTLDALDSVGVGRAGAGRSPEEAERPVVLSPRGIRVAMLAFTDNEDEWEVGGNKPGTFYVPVDLKDERAKRLLELVRATKEKTELLLVSCHWGPNWGYDPPPEHPPFARALIDAGADMIFGHSGHVFRGVEVYRRKPIIYCAGDFIDDYAVDPVERNDESCIFVAEADRDGIGRVELHPSVISHFQARLGEVPGRRATGEKIKALCSALGTTISWDEKCDHLEIDVMVRDRKS